MFQKFQNLRQGTRSIDDYATDFFKMINSVELWVTEPQLVMRFIGGLRQQIQFTWNLFRPQKISEAHQQALIVEPQTRTGFSAWGSGRQTRSPSTTPASSSTPSDATTPKTETAIIHVDTQWQTRLGGFRCYSCGETGHRQSACPNQARRGLLLDEQPDDDNNPIYDDEEAVEELGADTGTSLMLRRSCLAPHGSPRNPQRNNLFHSKCTIGLQLYYWFRKFWECNVLWCSQETLSSRWTAPHSLQTRLVRTEQRLLGDSPHHGILFYWRLMPW